jgi:D-tyrosyl-tRNA(Tyr) deacylase
VRAVVQRVSSASVVVDGQTVAAVGKGLACLVGVRAGDTEGDLEYVADKLSGLRIFEDQDGKMNLGVREVSGAILLVPNFTLYGDCRKGRRPSFTDAAPPDQAEAAFDGLASALRMKDIEVATGRFGARMTVEIRNDGPVTLVLDSNRLL